MVDGAHYRIVQHAVVRVFPRLFLPRAVQVYVAVVVITFEVKDAVSAGWHELIFVQLEEALHDILQVSFPVGLEVLPFHQVPHGADHLRFVINDGGHLLLDGCGMDEELGLLDQR